MGRRVTVARVGDVPPGGAISVRVEGQAIALFNVEGRFFALADTCPHQGAPLSEGTVSGGHVICPWHGAEFELASGRVLSPPATTDVPAYPVHVEGEEIQVEIP